MINTNIDFKNSTNFIISGLGLIVRNLVLYFQKNLQKK